jgi:uncharacterized protein
MAIQRLLARALLPALVFGTAWRASALDPSSLKPQGYVSDFAHVVDDSSRTALEQYCGQVERATGVQMALVTIPSLEGEPIEDFSNTLFRKWGVGKKGKDEGIMLLLVVQDHKDRIEVGYGLEPILPDGFVGGILRQLRPYLTANQYGGGMLAAAQQMGAQIAQAKNVSLGLPPLRRSRRAPVEQRSLPWPLVVVGILVLLFLIRRGGGGGGFLAGMILGNVLGRSGRWGGGGFGGYDSGGGGGGGGFGGFGGGDSGGGGASGDW